MIPKIIFQTWKTHDVPEHWKKSPESIRKYMPEWEYVLFSDDDNRRFVEDHFPYFLSYYDSFQYPIQRADAIRYMWLYINGGLYLDLDIELIGSLDHLFEEGDIFFTSSCNAPSSLTNSIMASKKGHRLWLEMIEEAMKPTAWYAVTRHLKVMMSAGPDMVDRVVKRSNHSFVLVPKNLVNPYCLCDREYKKRDALIKPLKGGSWMEDYEQEIYRTLYCNQGVIAVGVILLLILLIVIAVIFFWSD